MTSTVTTQEIDGLWLRLQDRLASPQYADTYESEPAFEAEVWKRVVALAVDLGMDVRSTCLTSHTIHSDRSEGAWQLFCREPRGPDVNVLGSNNRLDIVLRYAALGSVGIEVKCLGASGHAAKLTQGLGKRC